MNPEKYAHLKEFADDATLEELLEGYNIIAEKVLEDHQEEFKEKYEFIELTMANGDEPLGRYLEWVDIKERLPEKDGAYLCLCVPDVATEKPYIQMLAYGNISETANEIWGDEPDGLIFNTKAFGCEWSDGVDNLERILYWMELPDAPNKNKEELNGT